MGAEYRNNYGSRDGSSNSSVGPRTFWSLRPAKWSTWKMNGTKIVHPEDKFYDPRLGVWSMGKNIGQRELHEFAVRKIMRICSSYEEFIVELDKRYPVRQNPSGLMQRVTQQEYTLKPDLVSLQREISFFKGDSGYHKASETGRSRITRMITANLKLAELNFGLITKFYKVSRKADGVISRLTNEKLSEITEAMVEFDLSLTDAMELFGEL